MIVKFRTFSGHIRDAMLRQVSEAVAPGNAKVGTIINTKNEWNYVQPPIVVIDNGKSCN